MALFDRLHTEPVYNTRAVVQRTGVPADTIRAWERRYQFPAPCRTESNQRLYSERDVAVVCWLRDQTRAGMTISHAVTLYRALLTESGMDTETPVVHRQTEHGAVQPGSTHEPTRPHQLQTNGAPAAMQKQATPRHSYFHTCLELISALSSYDGRTADSILDELIAVASAETVCHEVLQPALAEIGRRWETGALCTSAEHFASAYVQRKIHALFNVSRPETGKGPILAACVEGEAHELGLLFVSLFLSRSGFEVIYLGGDLPAADLVMAVNHLRPPLVLLSASTHEVIPSLERTVRVLRESVGNDSSNGPVVGFGGSIFNRQPEQRCRIEAAFLGTDGYQAVHSCDRLLNGQSLPA
jgi:MerR family transcriptional regulator, light-induced transcriptional regulator